MKFDLNACGVQEMEVEEMRTVDGGKKVEYLKYTWSGTSNSLIYAAEGVANGCKAIINGGIWVWNQFQ